MIYWAIPEKSKLRKLRIYFFLRKTLEFVTLPSEIPEKISSGNSEKLCDTPWKFQGQKLRPMEIPHEFFFNTPEISLLFWLISGTSTSSFFNTHRNSMSSMPPVCIFSGIAHCICNNNNRITIIGLKYYHGCVCMYYLWIIRFLNKHPSPISTSL